MHTSRKGHSEQLLITAAASSLSVLSGMDALVSN